MNLPTASRNPQRAIDILFQRLLLVFYTGISGIMFVVILGRLVQARKGGLHPILFITPGCSFLFLVAVVLYLRGGRPSRRRTDGVMALVMILLSVVFAIGSMWQKDPLRLFNFAPFLVVSGLFQRNLHLFFLTHLVLTGGLVFAWLQAPFPRAEIGMAMTVFTVAWGFGVLTHLLVQAMVRRIQRLLDRLMRAKAEIQQLAELIPICSHCKKVRNDQGYWEQVESYVGQRTHATFSHGICPDCLNIHWPSAARNRVAREKGLDAPPSVQA